LQRAQMGELNFRTLKELLDKIQENIGKDNPTENDFSNYKAKNKLENRALKVVRSGMKDGTSYKDFYEEFMEGFNYYTNQVKYHLNMAYDSRDIVGDNYEDSSEQFYGNNDVEGPDANHGTHVAGIIAADRNNNLGARGIADNVKIMSVRAVPNGDERDKDVARSEEHTSELQSRENLVCRLLLEKKK